MLKTFCLRKGICVILSGILLAGLISPVETAASDYSYILIEAGTGTVLEEQGGYTRRNCGYMSKLMTVLLAAEDIETGRYTADTAVRAPQSVENSRGAVVWLEPGDEMTVGELMKSVIIGNANDACEAIAVKSEQSVENFVMRMNARAFDMGLRNTVYYSPQGYYDEREYTTAYDLAMICSRLSEYDFLEEYFATWRDFVKEGSVELVNENSLSRTFDAHTGFKAAHSDETGYCIAEGGRSPDGTVYIAVVLGAPDEETAFSAAKALVRKGFSDYRKTVPGFLDELLMPVRVRKGVEGAVELKLNKQSAVVIPKGSGELTNVIITPTYLDAPVEKGQRVGTAGFYSGKTLVYETAIIAQNDVEKLDFGYVLKRMLLKLIKI